MNGAGLPLQNLGGGFLFPVANLRIPNPHGRLNGANGQQALPPEAQGAHLVFGLASAALVAPPVAPGTPGGSGANPEVGVAPMQFMLEPAVPHAGAAIPNFFHPGPVNQVGAAPPQAQTFAPGTPAHPGGRRA